MTTWPGNVRYPNAPMTIPQELTMFERCMKPSWVRAAHIQGVRAHDLNVDEADMLGLYTTIQQQEIEMAAERCLVALNQNQTPSRPRHNFFRRRWSPYNQNSQGRNSYYNAPPPSSQL